MPYIRKELRNELTCEDPLSAGELNYAITVLIKKYLGEVALNYTAINEVIGVLECAKLELYRRVAVPYEDSKKEQHGDVY